MWSRKSILTREVSAVTLLLHIPVFKIWKNNYWGLFFNSSLRPLEILLQEQKRLSPIHSVKTPGSPQLLHLPVSLFKCVSKQNSLCNGCVNNICSANDLLTFPVASLGQDILLIIFHFSCGESFFSVSYSSNLHKRMLFVYVS